MLAKRHRLSRQAFSEVFRTARRSHSPLFSLYHQKTNSLRCAVVVSKKIYQKAHDRNRLRRQAYGLLEKLKQQQMLRGDLIIIFKPAVRTVALKDWQGALGGEIESIVSKGYNS